METLLELARSKPTWSLEEFVSVVNEWLPQVLLTSKGNTRVREEVNPRLVRHYTSLKMLDEPKRSGKYALYTYRHLLQILVVRRLLAEGIGTNAIEQLATQKSNTELEDLLTGGVQFSIAPTNPALAYLEQLRQPRANVPASKRSSLAAQASPVSGAESAPTSSEETYWIHIEIAPGLEIHLHSDYTYPKTPSEQIAISQKIAQKLQNFSRRQRKQKK